MGYTHYYKLNRQDITEKGLADGFKLATNEIKFLLHKLPADIKICDGLGENEPIINEKEIWFNGDASQGLDHETFSLCVDIDPSDYQYNSRMFTKTARKPYDLLVCCALISLRKYLPNAFWFTSDGDREDWQDAISYYDANLPGNHAFNLTAHL